MQNKELYVVMLNVAEGATPQRVCYVGEGSGIPILRETPNCWHVNQPPHRLPERFRKAEEYKLLNNRFGIDMFGRVSTELTAVLEVLQRMLNYNGFFMGCLELCRIKRLCIPLPN